MPISCHSMGHGWGTRGTRGARAGLRKLTAISSYWPFDRSVPGAPTVGAFPRTPSAPGGIPWGRAGTARLSRRRVPAAWRKRRVGDARTTEGLKAAWCSVQCRPTREASLGSGPCCHCSGFSAAHNRLFGAEPKPWSAAGPAPISPCTGSRLELPRLWWRLQRLRTRAIAAILSARGYIESATKQASGYGRYHRLVRSTFSQRKCQSAAGACTVVTGAGETVGGVCELQLGNEARGSTGRWGRISGAAICATDCRWLAPQADAGRSLNPSPMEFAREFARPLPEPEDPYP
jgi:hypothetical protein